MNEMVADRRPFVGIDPDEITYKSQLIFDNAEARINFDIWLRNTGKSVAINATSTINVWPPGTINISPLIPQGQRLSAAVMTTIIDCNKKTVLASIPPIGTIIMPGGKAKQSFDLHTRRELFRPDSRTNRVSAWLPICLVYRDDEGNVHGTGFVLVFESGAGIDFAPIGNIEGRFSILTAAGANVF